MYFWAENVDVLTEISLKFVPEGKIVYMSQPQVR